MSGFEAYMQTAQYDAPIQLESDGTAVPGVVASEDPVIPDAQLQSESNGTAVPAEAPKDSAIPDVDVDQEDVILSEEFYETDIPTEQANATTLVPTTAPPPEEYSCCANLGRLRAGNLIGEVLCLDQTINGCCLVCSDTEQATATIAPTTSEVENETTAISEQDVAVMVTENPTEQPNSTFAPTNEDSNSGSKGTATADPSDDTFNGTLPPEMYNGGTLIPDYFENATLPPEMMEDPEGLPYVLSMFCLARHGC